MGPGSLRYLYSLLTSKTSLFQSPQPTYPWTIQVILTLIIYGYPTSLRTQLLPWLMWLSGLEPRLRLKGCGFDSGSGHIGEGNRLMFLSLPPSLSFLKAMKKCPRVRNKKKKKKKNTVTLLIVFVITDLYFLNTISNLQR